MMPLYEGLQAEYAQYFRKNKYYFLKNILHFPKRYAIMTYGAGVVLKLAEEAPLLRV